MNPRFRRTTAFLDAVVRERRPRRFPADPDEAELMRVAAALHAAHPGTGEPAPEFVDDLARRLRARAAEEDSGGARIHRRRFLKAAGVAAAAAAAGVAGDRLVEQLSPDGRAAAELVPEHGRWTRVADAQAVSPGRLLRFTAGGVEGVLVNRAGVISALSAICTHMGCTLRPDEAAGRLVCPCHASSFALDGRPSPGDYALAALPRVRSRVIDGGVEVFVA